MLRQWSAGASFSVAMILFAAASRLSWLNGTIFGREVVPEVCSTSAIDSPPAKRALAVEPCSRKYPDGAVSGTDRSMISTPSFSAAAIAGLGCRSQPAMRGLSDHRGKRQIHPRDRPDSEARWCRHWQKQGRLRPFRDHWEARSPACDRHRCREQPERPKFRRSGRAARRKSAVDGRVPIAR
jgi:hypothetical protein